MHTAVATLPRPPVRRQLPPAGRPERLSAGRARRGPTPSGRSHRPSAAVYWRRRAVAGLCGLGLLLAGSRAGATLGGPTTTPGRRLPTAQHTVHYVVRPGDTLWSIAGKLAPGADPRQVVDLLAEARGTTVVVPGQVIDWQGI